MRRLALLAMRRTALTLAVLSIPVLAHAQSTGSVGCAALTQAAADAISARVQADDAAIRPPSSVKNLTCLDGFFRGVGLNVIANLLDPTSLLDAVNEAQQAQLRARGVEPPAAGSWMQVLALEVERRFSDVGWAASLQAMTPAAVNREIAQQLALSNYLALASLRQQMQSTAVDAANLAVDVERGFTGFTPMPSPTIAAN